MENFLKERRKALKKGKKEQAGRNNQGRITVRRRGGGHKRSYRSIDFFRKIASGEVHSVEYDPNRSGLIALVGDLKSKSGWAYVLAPKGLVKGDILSTYVNEVPNQEKYKKGNAMLLSSVPLGASIYNIGGKYVRAGGTSAVLLQKEDKALVKLPSGLKISLPLSTMCSIGEVESKDILCSIKRKKAGRSRWLSKRPSVRGVAMNPVDHPHGGGEGKTSGGRHPVTPWGRLTKGYKTRRKARK